MNTKTLLLLLILPALLCSEPVLPITQPGETMGGAVPVIPSSHLLDQAYTNILKGNYSLAEKQYKNLSELDPTNSAAWEGLLWAKNLQGKYTETLRLSKSLLKDYPNATYPYNYRAYALLRKHSYSNARYHYQRGLVSQPGNYLANQVSREGLASAYLALDDYPQSQKQDKLASALAGKPFSKSAPAFSTTLFYKLPGEDKTAFGIKQGVAYKNQSLGLAYEDFLISGESYRKSYRGDYRIQFSLIDISTQGKYLNGSDERVYPVSQAGVELSPKLYPSVFAVRPAIMASYSRFQQFDVQQLSFKPLVRWRDISLRYCVHAVNIDHEIPNADSLRISQQAELSKNLPWDLSISLHYGLGNDSWSVDNAGNLIDTFNQMGSYYGIGLSKNLFHRFYLYAYYQLWDSEQLLYFSLTGRY